MDNHLHNSRLMIATPKYLHPIKKIKKIKLVKQEIQLNMMNLNYTKRLLNMKDMPQAKQGVDLKMYCFS